jgi:hypothetical protein
MPNGSVDLPAGLEAYSCLDCMDYIRVLPTYWLADDARIEDVVEGRFEEHSLHYSLMKLIDHPRQAKKVTLSPPVWEAVLMPDQALDRAWQDSRVREVFQSTLELGSRPLSEVRLVYMESDSSIFYQIRFLDKVCPCSGFDSDYYNVADVIINPVDGTNVYLDIEEGVSPDEISD